MNVFADYWIDEIKARYRETRDHDRPYLYHVAINDAFRVLREEIEVFVSQLPESARSKIIPRLRAPDNFRHTYHEIVVGNLLRECGYDVDYERPVHGLEPDWYVSSPDGTQPFVVEVFTADISESRKSELHHVSDLIARLQEIPVGVVLYLQNGHGIPFSSQRNKRIATEVRRWLMSDYETNSRIIIDDMTIEVITLSEKYNSVQCIGPGDGFMVDKAPLRKRLSLKLSRYGVLADSVCMPLVVAVIAEFMTGLDLECLYDVLLGQEAVQITFDQNTGTLVQQRLIRHNDGVFSKKRGLSSALWVYRDGYGKWTLKNIPNPIALNTLSFQTPDDA